MKNPARKTRSAAKAPARKASPAVPPPSDRPRLADRAAHLAIWLLLILPPVLVIPGAKEAFRLPKLQLSEWLGFASLLFLAWRIRTLPEVRWRDLWQRPVVAAVLPVLVAAGLGFWTTRHPAHFREATIDLWIGAACLVGFCLALPLPRLSRFLVGLLVPATLLAVLGILQFHGLYRPLIFLGVAIDERLAITSTAGNPGDLGAYLVLPCLAAQWWLARREGLFRRRPTRRELLLLAGLAVCLYAVALTQTLAALAALALGTLVLWGSLLPWRTRAVALAAGAAVLLVTVLALPPLRARALEKSRQALAGDWNSVLTGRLDGFQAAAHMFAEHPLTGVGHGAYRPEYIPAKLALLDRGVSFYARQTQVVFANAHNEFLEVAAEWGIPGIAALGWGLWVLGRALCRRAPEGPHARRSAADRAFAWAGALALGVLALVHFPFRIALVAYPALLFLAWTLRRGDPAIDLVEESA